MPGAGSSVNYRAAMGVGSMKYHGTNSKVTRFDLPGQLSMKFRQQGQLGAPLEEPTKDPLRLQRELEEKERKHFEEMKRLRDKRGGVAAAAASSSGESALSVSDKHSVAASSVSGARRAAAPSASALEPLDDILAAFDDRDDNEAIEQQQQHKFKRGRADGDDAEHNDASGAPLTKRGRYADSDDEEGKSSDSSGSEDDEDEDDDDDEDDTEELMRELERIKREREAERQRKESEAAALAEKESTEAILKGNPLLTKGLASALGASGAAPIAAPSGSAAVRRRFGDDTVFSNTHASEPDNGSSKKRFINDMIRSDFNRRFLKKFVV